MKILYLECNMGAAGDMFMAALLELLPDREAFLKKLNNLGIPGVKVKMEAAEKCGIMGTHVSVLIGEAEAEETSIDVDISKSEHSHGHSHDHDHGHGHDHHHEHSHEHQLSGMGDIEKTLSTLAVSDKVKKDVLGVYQLIAEAESKAHGRSVEEVHFHEVGNLDAIADITGACMLMEELAPEKVFASPVHVGSGFVRCSHGILPVPAPATAYILRGIPTHGGRFRAELCTPTGAALLKYFVHDFGPMPVMKVQSIGYGMGKKDFEAANCLRAFFGEGEGDRYGPK